MSYEAIQEDPIDSMVEAHARQLPTNCGKALLLRRIAPTEYEVDGCRVSIAWRGSEVCAFPPRGGGSPDEPVPPSGEPLGSYLNRVAERAFARQMMQGQLGQSFERQEGGMGISAQQQAFAMHQAAAGQHWAPGGGSFLVPSRDGGSFLIGRDGGSQSGSFYAAGQVSHAPAPGKDPRFDAMRMAGGVPVPVGVPTPMQVGTTASFYMRADQQRPASAPHKAPAPGGGASTPTMPGGTPGMPPSNGVGLPPRQASALVYGPSYVAVNGG